MQKLEGSQNQWKKKERVWSYPYTKEKGKKKKKKKDILLFLCKVNFHIEKGGRAEEKGTGIALLGRGEGEKEEGDACYVLLGALKRGRKNAKGIATQRGRGEKGIILTLGIKEGGRQRKVRILKKEKKESAYILGKNITKEERGNGLRSFPREKEEKKGESCLAVA